jgi:addiction module HigA family antidote
MRQEATRALYEGYLADVGDTNPYAGRSLVLAKLWLRGYRHMLRVRIAKAIDVPPRRINEIVHGKRGISADTALRLSRALGLTDMFFINVHAHYDAEIAREQLATELATIGRIA